MQQPPKIPAYSYKNFFAIPKLVRPDGEEEKSFICPVCDSNSAPVRNAILKKTNDLKEVIPLSKAEIATLIRVFFEIKGKVGNNMSYNRLSTFFQYTFDTFCPLALEGLARGFDRGRAKMITPDDFVIGMYVILQGTIEERAKFSFRAFDIDMDGFLRRSLELASPLQNIFNIELAAVDPEIDPDEPRRDTIEYLMKKLDVDKDGKISEKDFVTAVKEEPLLMESIFSFWPHEDSLRTFQRLLMSNRPIPSILPPTSDISRKVSKNETN